MRKRNTMYTSCSCLTQNKAEVLCLRLLRVEVFNEYKSCNFVSTANVSRLQIASHDLELVALHDPMAWTLTPLFVCMKPGRCLLSSCYISSQAIIFNFFTSLKKLIHRSATDVDWLTRMMEQCYQGYVRFTREVIWTASCRQPIMK